MSLGKIKQDLILLNKSDLSDERKNETWASYFKEKGFYVVKLDARRRNRDERNTECDSGSM